MPLTHTAPKIAIAIELWRKGLSTTEIQAETGISPKTVCRWVKLHWIGRKDGEVLIMESKV